MVTLPIGTVRKEDDAIWTGRAWLVDPDPDQTRQLIAILRTGHWQRVVQCEDGDWPICNHDGQSWPCWTEQILQSFSERG